MAYVAAGYVAPGYALVEEPFAISAAGIASTLALGSPSLSFTGPAPFAVSPAGIASTLSLGTPSLSFTVPSPFSVSPSGIPSTLTIGSPTLSFAGGSTFSVAPAGIASTLQIGVPSLSFTVPATFAVTPAGIGSTLAFGSASASFQHGDAMEPVTLQEAKDAARFDGDELDALIEGVISAARKQAEHITQRVYRRRSFAFELDDWPADGYVFPVFEPDLCSVSYFNESRAWVALDASAFEFAPLGSGAEIAPALDTDWPTLGRRAVGARVRVTFTAGPASRDDVDEQVKLYIKASVSAWINNPDAVQAKALTLSPLFEHLLDEQRVYG